MAKPNVTWPQFAVCNDDSTTNFEDMCRTIFKKRFAGNQLLHANNATPGIEVLPVLEPVHDDGTPQKRISFQAKYFKQGSVDYGQIKKSFKAAVDHFKGKLDLVYLFCNKVLTTTSKGYKSVEKILNDVGIELVPISDVDLLELVRDYPDVSDYYFLPRQRPGEEELRNTGFASLPGVFRNANGDVIVSAAAFSTENSTTTQTNALLEELIEEKLKSIRKHAIRFELPALKAELDKLLSSEQTSVDSLPDAEEIYFFKVLTTLYDGGDAIQYIDKCGNQYKSEAEWIVKFYAIPAEELLLTPDEFKKHSSVIQIFAIDRLLTAGNGDNTEPWQKLVDLYSDVYKDSDPETHYQMNLHYGLALMNLRRYKEASSTLHVLYEETKEDRILLYATFADISIQNALYQNGRQGNDKELARLLKTLIEFAGLKQYKENELFVAGLTMEASYHLGISDTRYLDEAIAFYDSYSDDVKNNATIKYFYGLCLELNGEREKAVPVYATLDWAQDPVVAERYMLALNLSGQANKALEVYEQFTKGNTTASNNVIAAYLFALESSRAENFYTILNKTIEEHNDSLMNLFECVNYTDTTKQKTKDIVISALKPLINEESLVDIKFYQKVEILTFLSHSGEITLVEDVLDSIEDVSLINEFAAEEIYKALFQVANKEYRIEDKEFQVSNKLEAADRIASRFLYTNVLRKNFLQIKILCAGAKQSPYSSLKYSKELYEITHDEQLALSIVSILVSLNKDDAEEYEEYLDAVKHTNVPEQCMTIAFANLFIGREDDAEFYAYKALYLLNGKTNYDVLKSYFSFQNYNLRGLKKELNLKSAHGNVVVMLHPVDDKDSNEKGLTLCLDSENEFSDPDNRSLGIKHLPPSDVNCIKLHGAGLRQILTLYSEKYQIVTIMPREKYALKYIYDKVQENPDAFKGVVWILNTKDADELIENLRRLTDNSEQIKSILSYYHLEYNDLGLPFDTLAHRDYARYIDAMAYLLYRDGEAFYAGQPINEDETGQTYVPDLSTLVLMALLDRMDILDAFRSIGLIQIPKSYIKFFKDRYTNALDTKELVIGSLSFIDGKPLVVPANKKLCDIWENILSFCEKCKTADISDDERAQCQITSDLSGERLSVGLGLDYIHLDALILAQRNGATFVSDDLFFRKVASAMPVRNINSTSLAMHFRNENMVYNFIMELSKTNYIYIPLIAKDDKSAQELYKNIMTGDRKKSAYVQMLRYFEELRKRIVRQLFKQNGTDSLGENSDK